MSIILIIVVVAVVVLASGGLVIAINRRRVPSVREREPKASVPIPSSPATAVDDPTPVNPPIFTPPSATGSPDRPLGRPRGVLGGTFSRLRSRRALSGEFWDEMEEALIVSDVGLEVASKVVGSARRSVEQRGVVSPTEALGEIRRTMVEAFMTTDRQIQLSDNKPSVILFVGVNGVGKTTSIGKLASRYAGEGLKVVVAAGDTFRAAAAEQLDLWAQRAGVEIVSGESGSDPAAVIFDAITHASAIGADVVLADTAGRLQNRFNLMEELKKIRRVSEKASGTVSEVLLVLDATTGQNGVTQAQGFSQAAGITGVIVTKMDGSAKGGVAFAVESELAIPIKAMGVGESVEDLVDFDPQSFVEALTQES